MREVVMRLGFAGAALALASALVQAQAQQLNDTNPFLDQLAVRPGATMGILAIVDGKLVTLAISSGLHLDGSLLSVAFPSPSGPGGASGTPVRNEFYRITAPVSALTLAYAPLAPGVVCFRNGLRMTEGVDFRMDGQFVTFLPDEAGGPGNAPQAGDLFTFDYVR